MTRKRREKSQLVVIPALQSSVNNNGLLWEACWPVAGWTLGCCKYKYMHKYRHKYRHKCIYKYKMRAHSWQKTAASAAQAISGNGKICAVHWHSSEL